MEFEENLALIEGQDNGIDLFLAFGNLSRL